MTITRTVARLPRQARLLAGLSVIVLLAAAVSAAPPTAADQRVNAAISAAQTQAPSKALPLLEEVARTYINQVRNRSDVRMPPVTESGEALLKRIRHERQIELVFEGHRYFDVRRWKIANETETKNIIGIAITKSPSGVKSYTTKNLITRTWNDRLYLLPIPREEIDRSLGSLTQNPGY